ncbi:hypothetical protein HK105_203496 [Polyrhizophydium stewartii]|uniref:Uncharacterized protein n=1 Tax=Polyrhizophydium stewartii TaxID=2732419 RepID=A0ABR4NBZ6_9FUNG
MSYSQASSSTPSSTGSARPSATTPYPVLTPPPPQQTLFNRNARELSLVIPPGEGFFDRRRSSARLLEEAPSELTLPALAKISASLKSQHGQAVVQLYDLLSSRAGPAQQGGETDNIVDGMHLAECILNVTGVQLSPSEVQALAKTMSGRGNGIGIVEFITSLNGGLPSRRQGLVTQSFKQLISKPGGATINLRDVQAKFDANEHPRVRAGETTAQSVRRVFVDYWTRDRPDGEIRLVEWLFYFAGVSSSMESDAEFEQFMSRCWDARVQVVPAIPPSKVRRTRATMLRRIDYVVKHPNLLRSLLDLCIMRNPIAESVGSRDYLHYLLTDMFGLIGARLEEDTFQAVHKALSSEVESLRTVTDMEDVLRAALEKELQFLEYRVVARTTNS